MSKQGDITSFFKPKPKPPQSSQLIVSKNEASPTPPPRSPSLPPALFSSSPPAPTTAIRDLDTVIRGSDDEDEDDDLSSDDDFPELFPKPSGSTRPVQAPKAETSVYATPKAKRRALEFPSSPLTINTKHKFDMEALLKHAAADSAIEESEQRTAVLLTQGSPTARAEVAGNGAHPSLHETILDVLSEPEDSQDEGNRGRLLRAVKRTEATVGRKEWYFFDRQKHLNDTEVEVRRAFPKPKATGVWAFLGQEKHRSEAFEDGLAYSIQCRMQNLPDEIFQWVLDEAPREKSKKLRDEYVRLLGICSDQIGRLLDDRTILRLFQDLGASERALGTNATIPSGGLEDGAHYPEQNRIRLQTVLRILATTAHASKVGALTQSMTILLRFGIDNLIREDQAVATEYQDALHQIVLTVPWRSWDSFCGEVSESLHSHTPDATLRWNAVSSIPLLHSRLIELRRRLALSFVFDDPRRAFSPPEDTFSIRSIIDRLDQADEFVIDRNNTDYFELLALSEMLSVAVGDGLPPAEDVNPEAIKQYNAEVDELSQRIKHMWSNIHEQGAAYMSRLEVRVQLRDFERKLQHVVRTRPPPKEDIFGLNATEEDIDRPRQQQFMKRFFEKKAPPKTP